MSAAAARTESADVISLDDYRRMRAGKDAARSAPVARAIAQPMIPAAAAVPGPMWVYWVPVWIW